MRGKRQSRLRGDGNVHGTLLEIPGLARMILIVMMGDLLDGVVVVDSEVKADFWEQQPLSDGGVGNVCGDSECGEEVIWKIGSLANGSRILGVVANVRLVIEGALEVRRAEEDIIFTTEVVLVVIGLIAELDGVNLINTDSLDCSLDPRYRF